MTRNIFARLIALSVVSLAVVGCADRPGMTNSDPALHKKATQFAAESVKLHPFPADAARGGDAVARAEISYARGFLSVANLSDTDWSETPIWINRTHVLKLPAIKAKGIKTLSFEMFYDDQGNFFPVDHARSPIKTVEIVKDGKVFSVTAKLED